MYTIYANASKNTPFYTHVDLYVVRRVHTIGWEAQIGIKNSRLGV